MKYLLIEGQKAKIVLSPLKNFGTNTINRIIDAQNLPGNSNEFYVAITTQPRVNLGGILLKIRFALNEIKKALILSGESFKAPLRHFSETQLNNLMDSSKIKENIAQKDTVSYFSTNISSRIHHKLEYILQQFSSHILDLNFTFVALEGGFLLSEIEKNKNEHHNIEAIASMSQSLLSTSEQCSWLLKKMRVDSILIECTDSFQFINQIGQKFLFSTQVQKGRQKLGLLRLILPRYNLKIEEILRDIKYEEPITKLPNIESLFTELVISRG